MGAGDLTAFRVAGKTLFSLGLVKGKEGNLSIFDGTRLLITRTGSRLDELAGADVLEGGLDSPPEQASSDLALHVDLYRERGPGAIVHAHPPGSVPAGWVEGEPHGVYLYSSTLERAVEDAVSGARTVDERHGERPITPIAWTEGCVSILDQTRLPAKEVFLDCRTPEELAAAIRRLAIRGAPILGVAAAYGVALAARTSTAPDGRTLLREVEAAGRALVATRPTAVNIAWAVERVLARARPAADPEAIRDAALDEARRIEAEDAEACAAIGRLGRELVPRGANVLTHCNTGMLCTAGIGTAMGVIYAAHLQGKGIHVWVDETRPVWQGSRLTAWELQRLGVPMTLIPDAAAGSLMAAGRVDIVIVGADRIAADGAVANKIGTYPLAVLARHHDVPFFVAAPTSTIDLSARTGADVPVEERDATEVTAPLGLAVAPEGTPAANPAFDVTPAELVSALVTERGVVRSPYDAGFVELMGGRA